MATIPFIDVVPPGPALLATYPNARSVTFVADNDVSAWLYVNGNVTVRITGGTTFTIEMHQAVKSDQTDDTVIDTQVETQRGADYTFNGPCWLQLKLTAHTGTLPTARVSGGRTR